MMSLRGRRQNRDRVRMSWAGAGPRLAALGVGPGETGGSAVVRRGRGVGVVVSLVVVLGVGLANGVCMGQAVGGQAGTEEPSKRAKQDRPRRVVFAPGVLLDYRFPEVELEARVVLRRGPLELFACSRGTREHESVLQIAAKPKDVFLGMGLVGLTPGSPVHYDEVRKAFVPPHGESLRIRVLATLPVGAVSVPAESWMVDLGDGGEVGPIDWVFAGSRTFSDGTFGADADGTVVCVVDFGTALVAVGALHSADNAELWLGAHPGQVPVEGTVCKLLIGPRSPGPVVVSVDRSGILRWGTAVPSGREISGGSDEPAGGGAGKVEGVVGDGKREGAAVENGPETGGVKASEPPAGSGGSAVPVGSAGGEAGHERPPVSKAKPGGIARLGEVVAAWQASMGEGGRLRILELDLKRGISVDVVCGVVSDLHRAGVPPESILLDPRRIAPARPRPGVGAERSGTRQTPRR